MVPGWVRLPTPKVRACLGRCSSDVRISVGVERQGVSCPQNGAMIVPKTAMREALPSPWGERFQSPWAGKGGR